MLLNAVEAAWRCAERCRPIWRRPLASMDTPPRHSHDHHLATRTATSYMATELTRRIVLKVGMVGDAQIGKTSLMVKYVEGSFE